MIRYAPILAVDEGKRCWHVIGVIATSDSGEARVKVAEWDSLVRRVPAYARIERINEDFEEGEVSFYKRDPGEMASHVEKIRTDDPAFIDKYRDELKREGKWFHIGAVQMCEGFDVEGCIEELLDEVMRLSRKDKAS